MSITDPAVQSILHQLQKSDARVGLLLTDLERIGAERRGIVPAQRGIVCARNKDFPKLAEMTK